MNKCKYIKMLELYREKLLNNTQNRRLEAHLSKCSQCRLELQMLDDMSLLIADSKHAFEVNIENNEIEGFLYRFHKNAEKETRRGILEYILDVLFEKPLQTLGTAVVLVWLAILPFSFLPSINLSMDFIITRFLNISF